MSKTLFAKLIALLLIVVLNVIGYFIITVGTEISPLFMPFAMITMIAYVLEFLCLIVLSAEYVNKAFSKES